jgi:hypothetical protein
VAQDGLQSVPSDTLGRAGSALVGLIAVVLALSAIGMASWNALVAPEVFFIAFEALTLGAAVVAGLFALGRFRDGPALALLTVAGTVLVCAVLGYISANRLIGGVSITPYLLARVGLAAMLIAVAAWTVLSRRPRQAFRSLLTGAVAAAMLTALIAGAVMLKPQFAGLPPVLVAMLALLAAVIALGLLAASVHFTIRAFEFGHAAGRPDPAR